MTNNAQEHINQIKNKQRITYLDISNRDLAGDIDLKGFESLKSFNSRSLLKAQGLRSYVCSFAV